MLDSLIVGQGLAGSLLAWYLVNAGQRVCVVDDQHATASSQAAAGLVNPLAGMRFTRRPELGDWLDAVEDCYPTLERALDQPLWHRLSMLRLFRSQAQWRFYERQAARPENAELIGRRFDSANCPAALPAAFGGFEQHRTGYVDLPALLHGLRDWLAQRDAWQPLCVDHRRLRIGSDRVELAGLQARTLVFCEGARLPANPWFRHLPLDPVKGEILDLEMPDPPPVHIVNGAVWMVPQAEQVPPRLRLGATHERHTPNPNPTAAGRARLLDRYAALTGRSAPAVIGHRAGVRPGTSDHYPLLGRHTDQPRLLVFNGLGSRGSLTAPWYAQRLAMHLVDGAALPPEADIRRFR